MELILNTKGVTIAFSHPTPREAIGWRCVDHEDPEIFDPADDDALAEAKGFCRGCTTRAACLDLGVRREEWGVWGGVLLEGGKPIEKVKRRGRPRKTAA
jgi:hypothetical protein